MSHKKMHANMQKQTGIMLYAYKTIVYNVHWKYLEISDIVKNHNWQAWDAVGMLQVEIHLNACFD